MASEAEEILAIDTKEDIEDDENIIEIPIDEPPDRPDVPNPIKTREFQCEICFKVLSSKNNLKEIDPFCPMAWITWSGINFTVIFINIKKHKLIHEVAKYSCEICGKKFTYKWNMESHKVIHSGQKMFKCSSCPSSFFRWVF